MLINLSFNYKCGISEVGRKEFRFKVIPTRHENYRRLT